MFGAALFIFAGYKKNRPILYIGGLLFVIGIVGMSITVKHSSKEISGFKYQELMHEFKNINGNNQDAYNKIKEKYGSKITNMEYCAIHSKLEKSIKTKITNNLE